jgi:AraC family transcriptional regulator
MMLAQTMTNKLEPGSHYGHKNQAMNISGLLLSEYECEPNISIPKHSHERTYLSFVLSGGWDETYGRDKTRERRPHTLAIHPAGEMHSEQIGDRGSRAFHIEFSDEWLQNLGDSAAVLANPVQIENGPLIGQVLRLYGEFQRTDPYSPLIIEALVLESIGQLARQTFSSTGRRKPAWLTRALDIFNSRYTEPLSLNAIAEEVGIHPMHLTRTFRRYFGCSIGAHLRELRVQHACRLLATSNRPLAEIAMSAGFCDQSHLCRAIRRRTGLTPRALRSRGRKTKP